ncbi:bacteriohemerythrin [Patescibacteria group bacterium]
MEHDFTWKEEYSVQVAEIDDQHKQLINLIFQLFTAINERKTREKLESILNDLIDFSDLHFSTEEKYFEQFNYKDSEEHIEEHRNFTAKVLDLQKRYKNNEFEISLELIDFLEDWLLNHLIDLDGKYVKCFTSHGLK